MNEFGELTFNGFLISISNIALKRKGHSNLMFLTPEDMTERVWMRQKGPTVSSYNSWALDELSLLAGVTWSGVGDVQDFNYTPYIVSENQLLNFTSNHSLM